MPMKRRTLTTLLILLALFLLGTVAVLSTISFYLRIDLPAYITIEELEALSDNSTGRDVGRIPRIIHQTWMTETLPERWRPVSNTCKDMMPNYEYMLWTDVKSREFIAAFYPWFLPTFDAYRYDIQRADAIRYFVLYHFGGVYLDLDVGCLRSLDPLLAFPVILPKTIPVGVSNDLMFSEKGHPFMEQAIHNLITFDHSWILNYPTVMFSTGPMFISAQFGLYTSSHPPSPEYPGGDVRVLPKSLYGKNVRPEEAPNSFFSHHYGSSWHSDDAAFVTFLGTWGKGLMWVGLVVLLFGLSRLIWQRNINTQRGEGAMRRFPFGRYDVVLPHAYHRNGNFHLDLGFVTVSDPSGVTTEPSSPASSFSSGPPSPSWEQVTISSLPFNGRSSSSLATPADRSSSIVTIAVHILRRVGIWARASVTGYSDSQPRRPNRRNRGVMFFLPAIFTSSPRPSTEGHDIPLLASEISVPSQPRSRSRSQFQKKDSEDFIVSLPGPDSSTVTLNSKVGSSSVRPLPPPYEQCGADRSTRTSEWNGGASAWGEWTGEATP